MEMHRARARPCARPRPPRVAAKLSEAFGGRAERSSNLLQTSRAAAASLHVSRGAPPAVGSGTGAPAPQPRAVRGRRRRPVRELGGPRACALGKVWDEEEGGDHSELSGGVGWSHSGARRGAESST